MTENNSSQHGLATEHDGVSAVWLVPFIALIFGVWLTFQALTNRGEFISIEFDNANGIVAGKTEVRYKGLSVGTVKAVDVSKDFQRVIVDVEMLPSSAPLLTDKTQFWYVTADVSLEGVSGLETLLSGGYISILPDLEQQGIQQDYFVALKDQPVVKTTEPGLHVRLLTSELGSLGSNSPVTFKQMPVGKVTNYEYVDDSQLIQIDVFIEPEYSHLVRENSKFWISSGFNVTANLSAGLKIRTESLASIVSGGIAFDNPPYEDKLKSVENDSQFTLYRDYQAAAMGMQIDFILPWNSGLDRSASIIYQGINIGQLEDIKDILPEKQQIIATARIDPRIKPYLTDQTKFFVVSPKIDVSGVNNLNAILLGSYIGIRPSNVGQFVDVFSVEKKEPPLDYSAPGLHLVLNADDIGSLAAGAGVYNKHKQVGTIEDITFLPMQRYRIHLHIEPQYQHFINETTRFWNASGLRVAGGIQNFEIQAQSLKTILAGGIGFKTLAPQSTNDTGVSNGSEFVLFKDRDQAEHQKQFTLTTESAELIKAGGTRIMFQGKRIGLVLSINQQAKQTLLTVGIKPEFDWILKQDTQFWLVKPEISLSGITDTNALIGGAYIQFNVGDSTQSSNKFTLYQQAIPKHSTAKGLQLKLSARNVSGIKVGSQVSYKSVVVGHVDAVQIADNGEQVIFSLTIDEPYRHLVTEHTRFYKASGFNIAVGAQGLTFQTESVDAFLTGALSFYNPVPIERSTTLGEGRELPLYQTLNEATAAGEKISVIFNHSGGLREGMEVKSNQQTIGKVKQLTLNKQDGHVAAEIELNELGDSFAVNGSEFWLQKPSVNLSGGLDISALVSGNVIQATQGDGELKRRFVALSLAPINKALNSGLNLVLTASKLGSVSAGNPVLYRQVKVGEVIGSDLSDNAQQVEIYINIYDKYTGLVNSGSKFWHASGLTIEAGLLSGVTVETESVESLVSGGISFATPESGKFNAEQLTFPLHNKAQDKWLDWQPALAIKE